MNLMNFIADTTRKSFFFLAYSELRPSLRYIKKNYEYPLVGCEIGVSRGANAIRMLKNLPIHHLYLIEPDHRAVGLSMFKKYIGDVQTVNQQLIQYPRQRDDVIFGDKVTFLFDYSYNVAEYIPECSLEFCYIDGDHSYEGVKKDIELFYPKVKHGGVLCGHDFNVFGVAAAVCESFDDVTTDGYPTDWWVVKQ